MLTSPPLPEREADKVCDACHDPLPSRKGQLYKTFTTTRSRTYRTLIKRALTLSMNLTVFSFMYPEEITTGADEAMFARGESKHLSSTTRITGVGSC